MLFRFSSRLLVLAAAALLSSAAIGPLGDAQSAPSNPILFVTQVPLPGDFGGVASVFANHQARIENTPRGGDLWIRYPDGALKNLTAAAGYGTNGSQQDKGIAVREPSVHWSGTKAIFSMVVGAPPRYEHREYFWQLYEVTGLGRDDTPAITRVANQPERYNNVSPLYGTDDRIIFSSDRPRDGQRHLYPQLDEYESAPTTTGLWSLDPFSGDLMLLNHSPSGVFTPIVDSFGRVVFTRWDHLQRDQQADADVGQDTYGTFNYASEDAGAAKLNGREEVFPEPRSVRRDLLRDSSVEGHSFNHFFPWQINEDGTEEETLNHIGRHELQSYFNRSFNDDRNLVEFNAPGGRVNRNAILNLLQVKEDPARAGTYFGVDAPEFYTHAAGQIVSIDAGPGVNADAAQVAYVTHRDTSGFTERPGPDHSGLYRNPLPLSDGVLVAAHTSETRQDRNDGTRAQPQSRYRFRLKTLRRAGDYWVADAPLTAGLSKAVSYYDPDVLVSYSGELWELDAVEVRPRARPQRRAAVLEAPERRVLEEAGMNVADLQAWLRRNDLALVVSRNVTTRDRIDRQQPFNLRVAGEATETVGAPGKIYDVAYLQFFQGDLLRGLGGTANPRAGRRVLAQPMRRPPAGAPGDSGPAGSVRIGRDGSMAALVPSRRAMTWQLTDPGGAPVVRERYWITFQPGEIRVCTSCHGVNTRDQMNRPVPVNDPAALRDLLRQLGR